MSVVIDGTSGITTPAETVQGALTTTGNTILGDASTDTLNVGNGGLVKDASGNVGIGTASPNALLHVSNAVAKIRIGETASSAYLDISRDGATGYSIYNAAQADPYRGHVWQLGGTEAMRIDTAGLLKFNSGYGSVATAYGCRAWVNFNGTGTVTIRGSGNVSSITDNGVGDYTVNFTTAMVDVNYSWSGCGNNYFNTFNNCGTSYTTITSYQIVGSLRIQTAQFQRPSGSTFGMDPADATLNTITIFR